MIYNACVTLGAPLALKNTLGCQGRIIQLCFPLNLISEYLLHSELSYRRERHLCILHDKDFFFK